MTKEPFIAHSELTNEIYIVIGKEKYRVTEQAIKAVKAISSLEQEPTTKNDLGIDVPDNNVGKIEPVIRDNRVKDELNRVKDELEPTVDNDSAVDCIVDVLGSYTDLDIPYKREIAENILTNLPSVTSQPRKGHWIPVFQGDEIIDYRCSCCEFGNTFGKGTVGMNYCPRCGSRNEVEE